jgi:hypothetical protein
MTMTTRNWIIAVGVVCAFSAILSDAWHVYANLHPQPTQHSTPALFHQPYTGIEFRYPGMWSDVKGAHGIADFRGPKQCEVSIVGNAMQPQVPIAQTLDMVRAGMAQDQPIWRFSPRPAWAGPQAPDAGFAATLDKGSGAVVVEWDTAFQHAGDQLLVSEHMLAGDAACESDLLDFERSFRLFPADPKAD